MAQVDRFAQAVRLGVGPVGCAVMTLSFPTRFWRDFYDEDLSLLERIGSTVAIEAIGTGERHTSNGRPNGIVGESSTSTS